MVDDIQDAFSDVVTDIIDVIPRLVAAIAFLLVGMFVARFVVNLAHRALKAVNFDSWVDRSGLGGFVERAGYPDSGFLIARIVGWIITLVFIQLAVRALGVDSIETLINDLVACIPHVLVAIILIIITGMAARFARDTLSPTLSDVTAGGLVLRVITIAIWVIGGMMAIDELGFGEDIVDQLWTAITTGLVAIIVIKFGIGGIWAARDRFWPRVYDALDVPASSSSAD